MRNDQETQIDFDNFVSLEKSESKPKDKKKKENMKVTNSLLALAKAAGAKCFDGIEDQCDAIFGMHLGLRKKSSAKVQEKYYPAMEINLGQLNPQGVSTYLFLLKTRYPQFASLKKGPRIEDLYKDNNINVNQCALPAFQLALTAANQGMTQDQAIETVRAMFKVGGSCPLIPQPKKIDACAKASTLEEYKNATLMAAGLHVNGPRRMAVTTKNEEGGPQPRQKFVT